VLGAVAAPAVRVAAAEVGLDAGRRAAVAAVRVAAVEDPAVAAGARALAVRVDRVMARVETADAVMDAVATVAPSSSKTSLRSTELPRS